MEAAGKGPRSSLWRQMARLTLGKVMMQIPPAGMLMAWTGRQTSGRDLMRLHTYEITFAGQAGSVVRAELEGCEIFVGRDTTTVRAELPDQRALLGLVERIAGLGLEMVGMHLVAPLPEQ
jgi:hypothetical protein